jgi:N-acyl-D-aspartate/D-glutamate deacylase
MTLITALALLLFLPTQGSDAVQAEVAIRGATLVDGSGHPTYIGDLALRGDRIVAVGHFTVTGRPRVVDGAGLVVAPGFIDLHTHCDIGSPPLTTPVGRPNRCYVWQGVTTVITGSCGSGPTDVAAFFRALENGRTGTNVIHLVPHNSVRQKVMGNANRLPTGAELQAMKDLVDRGMRDGAWGFSTGLIYNPGAYAKTDEIITLARVAAHYGGLYASHIRDEGTGVLVAITEAMKVGQEAGLPVHISHLKASGRRAWGKSAEEIALIEQARAQGQTATADQYPYTASSTSLAATLVPPLFREGTPKDYLARLSDPEQGARIRQAIRRNLAGRQGGKSIRIARYQPNRSWQGKDLDAIATREGKQPVEIVLEIERHGGAAIVNFGMSEEDVRLIMKQPFVATASDGSSQVPGDTVPHPRSYGCFPRKIGRYALEEKTLSLEQAVRSASGLPADILRLPERGYLRVGYYADVVVFDPKTYRDRATFDKPHQYAAGVRFLFINGQAVIEDGKDSGALAGRVLRHMEKPLTQSRKEAKEDAKSLLRH